VVRSVWRPSVLPCARLVCRCMQIERVCVAMFLRWKLCALFGSCRRLRLSGRPCRTLARVGAVRAWSAESPVVGRGPSQDGGRRRTDDARNSGLWASTTWIAAATTLREARSMQLGRRRVENIDIETTGVCRETALCLRGCRAHTAAAVPCTRAYWQLNKLCRCYTVKRSTRNSRAPAVRAISRKRYGV